MHELGVRLNWMDFSSVRDKLVEGFNIGKQEAFPFAFTLFIVNVTLQ